MTVGWLNCHTGHTAEGRAFLGNPRGRTLQIFAVAPSPQRGNPRCSLRIGEGPAFQMPAGGRGNVRNGIPVAEPYKYSPWLSPRNEGTSAAAFESARVQPCNCSPQAVMLVTRKLPLQPLLFRERRKPFRRGLPYRRATIFTAEILWPIAAVASPWLRPVGSKAPSSKPPKIAASGGPSTA
jgi:hypothetical protein